MKKKLLLVFILSIFFIPNVKAADLPAKNETLDEYQQAVRDVAYGFYYRGLDKTLLYDQLPYNYQTNRQVRVDIKSSPEDITEQDIHYHMCSSYTWNVYYEAFKKSNGEGYNLGGLEYQNFRTSWQLALANSKTSYKQNDQSVYKENLKVLYITNYDEQGNEKKIMDNVEEYRQQIYNALQPGDIIVTDVLKDDGNRAGHALIYVGNNRVLDSSGSGSYNLGEKTNKIDTVQMHDVSLTDTVLTKSNTNSARILFCPWTRVIAIIRPLNEVRNSEYSISSKTRSRMTYNELVSTKLSSVNKYDSVNPGDEITYTIRLENRSETKDYNSIPVTDKIPENTDFVNITGNGTNNNGDLSWAVSVPKGQTKTISYTVKVKDDNNLLGTNIVSDKTSVGGISLKKITTLVKRTLTKEEQNNIKNKVKDGDSYSTSEEFINTIYPEFNFKSPNDMLSVFYDIDKNVSYLKPGTTNEHNTNATVANAKNFTDTSTFDIYKLKKNTSITDDNKVFYNMRVPGLFGGVFTSSDAGQYILSDGRSIFYNTNTLMVGDVLVMYDQDYQTDTYVTGEKNMYLYLGGSFASVKDGKVKVSTEQEGARLLESLIGQNSFIVLRPSFSMKPLKDDKKSEDSDEKSEIVVPNTGKTTSIILTIVGSLIIVIGSVILISKRKRVN